MVAEMTPYMRLDAVVVSSSMAMPRYVIFTKRMMNVDKREAEKKSFGCHPPLLLIKDKF